MMPSFLEATMRKASWILLTIVGVVILLFSLLSAGVSYYSPENDVLDGKTFAPGTQKDASGNVRAVLAFSDSEKIAVRARRGTAAAYAAAFAALMLFIVLGPYRRGETWAWKALFTSVLLLLVITVVRKAALDTIQGIVPAAIPCGLALLALVLDVGRLKRS
jgi:hypothetical protein